MIFGIDVSGHQGVIDWAKVRGTGLGFAVAKATEGTGYVSDGFVRNARGMRDAAMPVRGYYHFLRHGAGAAEARFFVGKVESVDDPDGVLLAVDCEKDSTGTDIRDFVREFRRLLPTHPLVVYTGGWWWRPRFGNGYGSEIGPLWESHYIDPSLAADPAAGYKYVPSTWWKPGYGGWAGASVLQFTSSARIAGITGRVDANAFRGSIADLRRLTWDSSVAVPPESSTQMEGDMAITAGGLSLSSDYVVPDVPAGTPLFDDAARTSQRTKMSKTVSLRYFGVAGQGSYAVLFATATGFADGQVRPVIGYVEAAAVKSPVKVPEPAPAPDTTPYAEADLEEARLAGYAAGKTDAMAEVPKLVDAKVAEKLKGAVVEHRVVLPG